MMRLLLAATAFCAFQAFAEDVKPVKNAGPYVPSPQSVVSDMLRYAEVGPQDFLIDLGSGDGRIVLTAAKVFGARGFGVEIKEDLVKQANQAAKDEGVADRVKFLNQDLFKTDISQATVITMYLLPDTVNLLKDKFLSELRPGTRIVSHDYPLNGWMADKTEQFDLEEKVHISGVTTTLIYVYLVPAKVAGTWRVTVPSAISKDPVTAVHHVVGRRLAHVLRTRIVGKALAQIDRLMLARQARHDLENGRAVTRQNRIPLLHRFPRFLLAGSV